MHRLHYEGDALHHAMHVDHVTWDVCLNDAAPPSVNVIPKCAGGIRALSVSGAPLTVLRGQQQLNRDSDTFIGILYQRAGRTIYERNGHLTEIVPGDIALWYSGYEARFAMPEPFRKLCMVIPVQHFQQVVPNAISYDGLRIEARSPVGALLGSWLTTLADDVIERGTEPLASCIDTTLDVLAATIAARVRETATTPKDKFMSCVMRYMEQRLDDPELTPVAVASRFGVSVRYLQRIFNERQMTVAGWCRARRLAKCRAELSDPRSRRTITEIAFSWGFSDATHFSRLFKETFGVSPIVFRRAHRSPDHAQ
ncbi:helix-turn-helix domain-containing protein [Paraburkholderia humisilvae]|nr:helix-turn-helix domain-containing protein [Paraburkholderia humisilvae]